MSDLSGAAALGASAPRRAVLGALRIEETADRALASLALRRAGTASSSRPSARPAPWGLALPGPGLWAVDGDAETALAAFWIGPDQWMIEAPGQAETDFAKALKEVAPDCSVTEQTDGWVVFEVRSSEGDGPLLSVLERLINLDAAALAPGRATRTLLEHLSVFVIRRSAERVAILGMRSAAESVWRALTTAARRQQERAE